MKETNILRTILLALPSWMRMFRNNTGQAWQGKVIKLESGDVLIKNPRPVNFGLCKGSSDLIGWTQVEITPDMVGKKVAVFTALEVKTDKGKATPEQLNFIKQVVDSGGISKIVTSKKDL